MLTSWYKTSDNHSVDAIISAINAPHVGLKAKISSIEDALTSKYVPAGSSTGESVVNPPEKFEQSYFDMITRFCLELSKSKSTISDICAYLKVCNVNSDVYEKISDFPELVKSFEHHQLLNKTDLSWLKSIAYHAQCSKATDVIEDYETLLLVDKIPWYSSHSKGTFLVGKTDKKPQSVTIKDSSNAKSAASKIVNIKESDSVLNFSEVGSVVFYWKILESDITIEIPRVASASLIKECKDANLTHIGILIDGSLSLAHINEISMYLIILPQ